MCSSQDPTHKIPDSMAKTWRGVCCPPLGCRTTPLLTPGLWGVTSGNQWNICRWMEKRFLWTWMIFEQNFILCFQGVLDVPALELFGISHYSTVHGLDPSPSWSPWRPRKVVMFCPRCLSWWWNCFIESWENSERSLWMSSVHLICHCYVMSVLLGC